jgi:hypothetical protein
VPENEHIITSDGELIHWGVKGMKWGVRRYVDKHGRLTPKGRQRYNQVANREYTAKTGKHGQQVLAKYEKNKTLEQKQSDKARDEAARKLEQSRRDRGLGDDFDFLDAVDRPGSKIGKLYYEAVDAETVRAQSYVGAKWYNKYNRELSRAIDKDNREKGYY